MPDDNGGAGDLPLRPYRVLDLSGEPGYLGARFLADMGADVLKIEPPGGDPGRRRGPFYGDDPRPERSLFWFAYNTNKRGITLNLDTADGRDIFRRLVARADFVFESFPPGWLAGRGLGFADLQAINPRLIVASITPFGQSGPWRDYAGSDIVFLALGGHVFTTGDPDRPPLHMSAAQAALQAGMQAAAGSMLAHYHRQRTGRGQHVDVSMGEAAAASAHHTSYYWELANTIARREGQMVSRAHLKFRNIWACQDGFISWRIFVSLQGEKTKLMVKWMNEEGFGHGVADVDWQAIDINQIDQAQLDAWETHFHEFFIHRTKAYLYAQAMPRQQILFPVNDVPDLLHDEQLAARDFWRQVAHEELGTTLTYPGPLVISNAGYLGPRRRAPLIGEHNEEIYEGELGLSRTQLLCLKQAGVI